MKLTLVLALALVATPLLLVPTAEAAGYCTNVTGSSSCPGTVCKWESRWQTWRCVDDPIIVCVQEPCP